MNADNRHTNRQDLSGRAGKRPGAIGHELIPNSKHMLKVVVTTPLEMHIEQVGNRAKLNVTAAGR